MRLALPLVAALALVGCNNYTPYLPDGGRARVNCDDKTVVKVAVTVVNRDNDVVPQAVVTVDYTSYGESENVIANDRGVALIEDKYGPGVARIQANVSGLKSGFAELNFNGTECSHTVTPNALTLQVK